MQSRIARLGESSRRVLVVTNPQAGARLREEAIRELIRCLRDRGLLGEVVTDLLVLDRLVAEYRANGQLRAVVAAGGDGTVAEIVNRTEPDVPVSVLPLGTANLLASYLGIERDPLEVANLLAEGATVRLDAGRANGRIFLLMAGCGFDAEVVERLHRGRRGHISYWSYAKPILESVRNYQYPDLRIVSDDALADGSSVARSARWAFVVNLPCYAAGLQLAPQAVGTDGFLDASTFGHGSFWHALRYLSCLMFRRHDWLWDYQSTLVRHVRIESDVPVPYQLDGDPGGTLPLDIDVLAGRLMLVVPAKRLRELTAATATSGNAGAR